MRQLTMWPDWIRQLPALRPPATGSRGWLIMGKDGQTAFYEFPLATTVPMHRHGPQIGFVVTGRIDLTIGDITETYSAGDSFAVPDQVEHGARIDAGTRVIEVYAQPDRHEPHGEPA